MFEPSPEASEGPPPRALTQAERLELLETLSSRGWLTLDQVIEQKVALQAQARSA